MCVHTCSPRMARLSIHERVVWKKVRLDHRRTSLTYRPPNLLAH